MPWTDKKKWSWSFIKHKSWISERTNFHQLCCNFLNGLSYFLVFIFNKFNNTPSWHRAHHHHQSFALPFSFLLFFSKDAILFILFNILPIWFQWSLCISLLLSLIIVSQQQQLKLIFLKLLSELQAMRPFIFVLTRELFKYNSHITYYTVLLSTRLMIGWRDLLMKKEMICIGWRVFCQLKVLICVMSFRFSSLLHC